MSGHYTILQNEMVEPPDGSGGYYKVNIRQDRDGECTCTIPGLGKCIVAKEIWKVEIGK